MVLVDEKTGQRYKVSPTAGSSVHLVKLDGGALKSESRVVEKLSRLRIENNKLRSSSDQRNHDLEMEQLKGRMLRNALRMRRTYIHCYECDRSIGAGDEHSANCRYYDYEMLVRP